MDAQQGTEQGSGTASNGSGSTNGTTEQVQSTQQQQQVAQEGTRAGNGRNLILPSDALGRIKQEQRDRGKRDALMELDKQAKEFGFESLKDAFASLAEVKRGGQQARQERQPSNGRQEQRQQQERQEATGGDAERPTPPMNRRDRQAMDRYQREIDRWKRQNELLAKRSRTEERRRRELQHALDAKDAEMALREAAASAGVKDIGYVIHMLRAELEGKDEKEVAAFDEAKYFEGLRVDKPYLFGEVVRPATTGTGVGGAPPAPKPGQVSQQVAASGKFDANNKDVKRGDFEDRLRKMGLEVPHM